MARKRTKINRTAENDHESDDAIEHTPDKTAKQLARDPMFVRGHAGRGGRAGHRHVERHDARPEQLMHRYNKTCIAITNKGTIIKRWEAGDDPHWVVGSVREIDKLTYICLEIRPIQEINYLIVKRAVRTRI